MRLYLKGVKGELLKAAEELALGREMEEATRAALDALARWPSGLASLVETAKRVQSGEANVMDFSSRTEPEPVREDHAELTPEVSEEDLEGEVEYEGSEEDSEEEQASEDSSDDRSNQTKAEVAIRFVSLILGINAGDGDSANTEAQVIDYLGFFCASNLAVLYVSPYAF